MSSCKPYQAVMTAKSRSRERDLCFLLLVYLVGAVVIPRADSYNILANKSYIIQTPSTGFTQFFGYDFVWTRPNEDEPGEVSFLIGSPKSVANRPSSRGVMSSPHTRSQLFHPGEIFACDFFATTTRTSCKSARPPAEDPDDPTILTGRDSLGVSVLKTPHDAKRRDAVVCAPLRLRNCSSNYLVQGACFSSDNFGASWNKETRQALTYCPLRSIDLIFVLDGSNSVNANDVRNFERVKDWVKRVSSTFDLKNFANIGVIQYSHWYEDRTDQPYLETEIELGQYGNQEDFKAAVDKIEIHGYTTFTAHAINKTVDDFMASKRFNDTSTRKVMILLTDGRSNDFDELPRSAEYARSMGIITFAVGVAQYVKKELQIIATGQEGNDDRVYGLQRFSDLQKIVGSLQKSISGILEGGLGGNSSNELEHSEVGIGGIISENGRLYLGAVGAYDWSGTVTKYDTLTDNVADIPTYEEVKRVLPNRTKESYMGYSVTTGTFAGGTTEYVATGAPRYKLMGAVVIYRPVDGNSQFNDDRRLMGHPSKRKLGSYFGGSVLAVDINGDGKDDLLVGAPLYVHESFDEGRVFVYETNRGSGTLAKWESDTYAPKELVGDNLAGGRFGTAMASAGDLNKDNFNDVIIGAPLVDGDRGAVFVYHGSIDGIDTAFKQKILASQLTGVTLKYFGQSLQGGVDLDGNKYPDIAVGAPKSDTVVIFRARPVVKITPEIKFSGDSAIDIFKCIIDDRYINCSAITVCLTASGTSIEPQISLKFNVTMDTKKADADKRLEFRDDVAKSGTAKFTWSEKFTVPRNTKKCFTKQVHMKTNVNDYDSNVTAEVEYDLTPEHTAVAMSSVRDPSKSNKKSAVLQFEQNCKGSCEPDLGVTLSLNVPSYTANNDQQNDLSQSNTILIVDKSTTVSPLAGRVNLSNFGENAFGARVRIRYPPEIGWRSVKVIDSNPPSNSCIVPDSTSETENGFVTQTLRFNSKTNIMRGNSFCHFEFSLITDPLKKNGLLDNFTVQAESFLTSDTATESKDKKTGNNLRQKKIGLLYTSDMSAKEVGSSVDISFNHTRNETRNITSVREIGNGTDDIVAQFTVLGNGYSKIPVVTTTLNFPWMTEDNETLLYLFDVTCQSPSSDSGTSCLCEHANVNYLNLSTEPPVENNTSENYVTVTRRTNVMENLEYNCNNASTSVICQKVKCTIQNLGERDEVTFQASFRLWTDNLLLNSTEERARLELRSRFEVNSSPSVRIIDANGIAPIVKSVESVVTARLYKPPSTPEPAVNNLWIYILAAVGGLLLLIILVLILWKLGFFKSKYADMKKDAQEDLQEETEFPDQNGSK